MTQPVSYLEINSPDRAASERFLADVFGWRFRPFADPGYLVADHGDVAGVDTGLMSSADGQPRAIPVIRVPSLGVSTAAVEHAGGRVVVPAFTIGGVGRGCYVTDPAGVLIGLHEYDADA
jgi:predicted enzyme related to lactoylglutathione lyase